MKRKDLSVKHPRMGGRTVALIPFGSGCLDGEQSEDLGRKAPAKPDCCRRKRTKKGMPMRVNRGATNDWV